MLELIKNLWFVYQFYQLVDRTISFYFGVWI